MEPQKQLTQNIVKYQDSKKAGKIKVLAHTDVYGNITAAIEQTVHDLVTGTEIIHVLAPVVVKDFDATLENIKKQLVDGDPNDPNMPWCMAVVERNGVEYTSDQYPLNKDSAT